jgi:Protein of unknown function (DUF3298)
MPINRFGKKTILVGASILWFALLGNVFAEESESSERVNKTYQLVDNIELTSAVKIDYDKPRIVIKAVYPILTSFDLNENAEKCNALINAIIDKIKAEFKQEVIQNQLVGKDIPQSARKSDLYIDFAASYLLSGKHPILSLRFSFQGNVLGQVHPYHKHETLNFDLQSGEVLSLADLFKPARRPERSEGSRDSAEIATSPTAPRNEYLQIFSDYSREVLSKKQLSSKEMIRQGTEAKSENFKHWNLKPNGILITFDEYQVGPYVDGAQTVLIPFAYLKEFLSENSPIMGCVTHKIRCLSSNFLTGGFIDEAANSTIRRIDTQHGSFNPILSKR